MIPLFSGILISFSQKRVYQRADRLAKGDQQSQLSSPAQFYDALANIPMLYDAMDTSCEPDSAPKLDNMLSSEDESSHNTLALSHRPFTVETSVSIELGDLDEEDNTQSPQNYEAELLSSPSLLSTPEDTSEISEFVARKLTPNELDAVFVPSMHPKSQCKGFVPPLPISKEQVAVQELLQATSAQHTAPTEKNKYDKVSSYEDYFTEFELTDFAIYLPPKFYHSHELRGLQDLASKVDHSRMLFDGILCAGSQRRYVQAVPFEICSIGNYGKEIHTVGGDIWIQSSLNKESDLFYRLKSPSPEYAPFHHDFLWLADLAKHFVDYCEECEEHGRVVSVHNFRKSFSEWVRSTHEGSADFQKWYEQYRGKDFRSAVSANINFLFKESMGVNGELCTHPIWGELLRKDIIPIQPVEQNQTIVTPYVYDCFQHLGFGQYLKAVDLAREEHDRYAHQGNSLHLTVDVPLSRPVVQIPMMNPLKTVNGPSASATRRAGATTSAETPTMDRHRMIKAIKVGDVLSVTMDGKNSIWKNEVSRWKAADDCWYIYVQEVHDSKNDERSFGGIWLYKPSDTSCAKMKYPFPNELFFSDNCNCKNIRIKEDEVIDVATVMWHGHPSENPHDLFIRQTYLKNDTFVTLKDTHKTCEHLRSLREATVSTHHKYPTGQTVLVAPTNLFAPQRRSKYSLDPYEIVKYEDVDSEQYAILRRLLRRHEIDGQQQRKPNELVYSDETVKIEAKKIERTCVVRFYSEADVVNQTIPAPYNRDGTGNAFYITSRLDAKTGILSPIEARPSRSLIQGFDPLQESARKKLRGLDLYCGGGNFGRGLEEGQAVHNEWAVDKDKLAIHTYFTNLQDPAKTKLYYGSVNDQLFQAMQGNPTKSSLIPRPGDVDFISAGSPCQGFSKLNNNRSAEAGLKNQSLVASVAAYVDFYRPKYGLLENVLTMAQKDKRRDQDVLSQLICAIVGMGYQLSTFILDAWSCGSSQSRSRIFVAFTAPGYESIPHPELSHSHPLHVLDRGLGQLASGKAFGERKRDRTPFNFVTANESVKDLPNIGNGATHSCIPYPDHVMPTRLSTKLQLQIGAIPTYPRDMSFSKAWNDGKGVMTKEQRALFPSSVTELGKHRENVLRRSKAWGRIDPNGLFSTITVASNIQDARSGKLLHWDQHRSLTVMEARRGQSFPDNEVIVGKPCEQFKIIGNSVDRCVSLALGLSLREAWEKNAQHDDTLELSTPVKDTSANSAKIGSLIRDERVHFSKKTANSKSSSARTSSDNTSPANATDNRTASEGVLPSIESPKTHHLSPKRVMRDSYGTSDVDDLSWRSHCCEPPFNAKLNSQPVSLKRPHMLITPEISTVEKSHKAQKLFLTASPSLSHGAEQNSSNSTNKEESNLLQQSRSQLVSAPLMKSSRMIHTPNRGIGKSATK
jgi:DNA (cytosine-5)-methyltransferase 1